MKTRVLWVGVFVTSLGVGGCGSQDTRVGVAESAAAMAKKSENAAPLPAADQAILDQAKGGGR